MAVNWGLAGNGIGNALGMFQAGAQLGQSARVRQNERLTDNALSALASNPRDEAALTSLGQVNPRLAMEFQQRNQQQAQQAQQQQRVSMEQVSQILNGVTPENYAERLATARQWGVDVSSAPAAYDPNWVSSQQQMAQLLQTPQGQEALSTAGKEAQDEGFRPGTPEFNRRVTERLNIADTRYIPVQAGGNVGVVAPGQAPRWAIGGSGSPNQAQAQPNIPQAAIEALRNGQGTPAQFDEVFGAGAAASVMGMGGTPAPQLNAQGDPTRLTPQQYQAIVNSMGRQAADAYIARNGIAVGQ